MRLKVNWSLKSEKDLENIFENIKERTLSENLAKNVVSDIFNKSLDIHFINQFQVDEFLGKPYRRIIIRNYKVIYISKNESEIKILRIFNTFQNPESLVESNL